jgi:hypothetical protein
MRHTLAPAAVTLDDLRLARTGNDHRPTALVRIYRLVLVPLSLASLLTGLAQSLSTIWRLFRHYWAKGAQTRSCSSPVLVEQATEQVSMWCST